MNSIFFDRRQAGQALSAKLSHLADRQPGWVLALPRGGVPVAAEIADALHWPLDVWLVRKLGAPNQPELAIGAIAYPDAQILNTDLMERLQVSEDQLKAVTETEQQELQRRNQRYRQGKAMPDIADTPVVLVDDGLATGATMQAAITALKPYHPASITVAVPVAAPSSLRQIDAQVDQTVCPMLPDRMGSISQWYTHFDPVVDDDVIAILNRDRDLAGGHP